MRSTRAFIGAATVVLSYPLAIAVEQLFGGGSETVIHLVTGTGFLVVAASVFDFDLPRWVNVVGAVAAGAFGLIFVLQGVADLTQLEWLRYLAFDVLGHHVERLLPDVVYLWFVALLLGDSRGWSRVLGWVVMTVVVGAELLTLVTLLVGSPIASVKLLILLPFVWLLLESGQRAQPTVDHDARRPRTSTAA
jgi:hypothetical protein